MGYTDETIRQLCRDYLSKGFTAFKLKVGRDLEGDKKRCTLIREEIGWDNKLVRSSINGGIIDEGIIDEGFISSLLSADG